MKNFKLSKLLPYVSLGLTSYNFYKNRSLERMTEELNNLRVEHTQLIEKHNELITKHENVLSYHIDMQNKFQYLHSKNENLSSLINNHEQLIERFNSLIERLNQILTSGNNIIAQFKEFKGSYNTLTEIAQKLVEDGKFKEFIDPDLIYKYFEAINNLTQEQNIYFINMCASVIILLALFSIFTTYYSNLFIDYLNLEKIFPKLARFLQLRRKLMSYYIKFDIFSIILCSFILIIVNLMALNII